MRILLLNAYYPPDTSATAKIAEMVAEALAQRHDVTVLAARPSYDPTERHPAYLLRREVRNRVTIERVGSTAYPRFQMHRRVSNYLTYLGLAVPRALSLPADVVLAMTDPPVAGIAGALVAALKRRPFLYNIRDLYPDMAVGSGILRWGPWVVLWEWLHRWALRRAVCVIVLGDDMRERIVAKGVAPERIAVVRDGVPIPTEPLPPEARVTDDVRCGFPFVLLHAGNLGFYGAWETLIQAARQLEADGVGLIFIGEGAQRERMEAEARGCRAVRFLAFRPAAEIPSVLAAADLHVVTLRHGLEGVVVPSKLYGILAAGKPVLAVAPEKSDVVRIVRAAGCGLVADPADAAMIVAAVRELRRQPSRLQEMGRRARAIAPTFARETHLRSFVEVVERSLDRAPRG